MSKNANLDKTLDKTEREYAGAFYTPKIWADEGHKEIEKVLGSTWREECIVWDCCAGSGNLTRDYDFNQLLLSSLMDVEVEVLKKEQGHKAKVFQYDFLGSQFAEDTLEPYADLPQEVRDTLFKGAQEGKRLVFLMNPPYATSGVMGAKEKTGVALSLVKERMVRDKIGKASNNLYAQFLYQCENVCKMFGFSKRTISVFAPISYMESMSYYKFRVAWYRSWAYQGGFIFQASHFDGLSPLWAVSFVTWSEGETDIDEDLIIDKGHDSPMRVISIGSKVIYSARGREASDWVREPVKELKGEDAPQMKSGLSLAENGRGKMTSQSLCYLLTAGNSLQQAGLLTGFFSASFSNGNGLSVLAGEGWRRAVSLLSARGLTTHSWTIGKSEYLAPLVYREVDQ